MSLHNIESSPLNDLRKNIYRPEICGRHGVIEGLQGWPLAKADEDAPVRTQAPGELREYSADLIRTGVDEGVPSQDATDARVLGVDRLGTAQPEQCVGI